jgi:hypothetical protein
VTIRHQQLELLHALERHGVPFVLIGGHAVNQHGHLRGTDDVDVVWVRSPEADHKLLSALTSVDAAWIGKEIDPATRIEKIVPVSAAYIASRHLMMLTTRYGFFDLFDYIPGVAEVTSEQALAESVPTPDGFRCVSLPLLRAMKEAAGRPKDLDDLSNLPPVAD